MITSYIHLHELTGFPLQRSSFKQLSNVANDQQSMPSNYCYESTINRFLDPQLFFFFFKQLEFNFRPSDGLFE